MVFFTFPFALVQHHKSKVSLIQPLTVIQYSAPNRNNAEKTQKYSQANTKCELFGQVNNYLEKNDKTVAGSCSRPHRKDK